MMNEIKPGMKALVSLPYGPRGYTEVTIIGRDTEVFVTKQFGHALRTYIVEDREGTRHSVLPRLLQPFLEGYARQ